MPNLRCGSPTAPYSVGDLLNAARHAPDQCVLRIACAYLSQTGLETIASQLLVGQRVFEDYRSEWVIGIDHGISEPRALLTILNWPRATLHLFCPGGRLDAAALRASPRLHAKVVAVINDNDGGISCVAASSANITGAALGPGAQNYEIGVTYETPADADARAFNRWWREVVGAGIAATAHGIERYADLRQRYLTIAPDRLDDLDPPASGDIRNARFLWIETGAMSGPPQHRHQIEFAEDLAAYFHAPRRNMQINLSYDQGPAHPRPLTFRGTARGQFVEIWRMGLLTRPMGGPRYANRVVRFTRLGQERYALEVTDSGSRNFRQWLRQANRTGYVGRTGAASATARRQFGFY
jgi:hypothetical protein